MDKFSKKEKQELIMDLIHGLVLCKSIDEAMIFLEDLITQKEIEILSKRLRIAKMLLEGFNYRDIQSFVHVSHGTIAKIAFWLSDRGEGFRKIIRLLPKRDDPKDPLKYDAWEDLKKRYPSYFLPELIVGNFIMDRKIKKDKLLDQSLDKLDSSFRRKRKANDEISSQMKDFYKKRR